MNTDYIATMRPDGRPYSQHPNKRRRQMVADGTAEPTKRQVWVGPTPGGHWETVTPTTRETVTPTTRETN